MQVSEFTYDLPTRLIADQPPKLRGRAKLLVLNKTSGKIQHEHYADLVEHLRPGDLVILNDTRVIRARLHATRINGQSVELLLVENHRDDDPYRRKAIYRGTLQPGERLNIGKNQMAVLEILDGGLALFKSSVPFLKLADQAGSVPLPPYMKREANKTDLLRYQTVFAQKPGSVAAPTASLNFTRSLQSKLESRGVNIAHLTLHVGLGTFLPIRSDSIENHHMHSEYFEIPEITVRTIKKTKLNGGRIVAIGTTVARTLEFAHEEILAESPSDISGEANIFIYPGYGFKLVDALLTNFHAPRSTVLMLTAAFAGWDKLKPAYDEAIKNNYRLLSYGDSMLIV